MRIERGYSGRIMSSANQQGAASKTAKTHSHDIQELERLAGESPSPEIACAKLAQVLRVQRNEVALFRVEKGSLRFLFPVELRTAGVIPLSSSAVAARTVATGTPLLSNSFARVKHVSLFESVKLGATADEQGSEQMPIQKIMSVPVTQSDGVIVGVIQISRKGLDPALAGGDFTGDDLKRLEQAAGVFARMPFMDESSV